MLIKNLLYILQSENYDLKRFLRYAFSHWKWWGLEKRQKLVWTPKIKLIYFGTWVFALLFLMPALMLLGPVAAILIFILEIVFLPFLILLALSAIKPLDRYFKHQLVEKAKKFLSGKKTMVIGITGSYGKTSTKEILYSMLSEKFKVFKTPENINTDIGIAGFLLKNLKDEGIVIVEIGTHYPGDIGAICQMIKPDFSILTGINEAHLERFRNLENLIQEKFVLPQKTKSYAVLNFDDKNIKSNYRRFNIRNFSGLSKDSAQNIKFADNFGGLSFDYQGINFKCGLLAEHNISLILLCLEIAKKLGMNPEEIKRGVDKIRPIEHRLSPVYNSSSDIRVLDDSYNGNKDGFFSGIKVLSRAKGRKVVLTPGLVELGEKTKIIHNEIGELYAKNADLVLLIKNKVSDFIISGMEKNNFKNYFVYNSTKEAHDDLKNILKKGDTIIFQNDWTDNYF